MVVVQRCRFVGLLFLVLGFVELLPFVNFALFIPDVSSWNIAHNATPYYGFVVAGLISITCGILAWFYKKSGL
jgi:hypothetical protein